MEKLFSLVQCNVRDEEKKLGSFYWVPCYFVRLTLLTLPIYAFFQYRVVAFFNSLLAMFGTSAFNCQTLKAYLVFLNFIHSPKIFHQPILTKQSFIYKRKRKNVETCYRANLVHYCSKQQFFVLEHRVALVFQPMLKQALVSTIVV